MTELSPPLVRLGNELERAARADLGRGKARRRRVALVVSAATLVIGGAAAFAADRLISTSSVAHSLPAGTAALIGTDPSCTVVEQGVEYHCTLAKPPSPEISDWKGTVEPTVDATKHVNGGCRALASDGRAWECYLGRAAVDQRIIGEGLLGEYAPAPGHG